MATITINENSKEAKAFLEYVKTLAFVTVTQVEKPLRKSRKKAVSESPYNPEFVAKIKNAQKEKGGITIDPRNVWTSIK